MSEEVPLYHLGQHDFSVQEIENFLQLDGTGFHDVEPLDLIADLVQELAL